MQKNDLDPRWHRFRNGLARSPNDPALLYLQGESLPRKDSGHPLRNLRPRWVPPGRPFTLQPTLGPAHDVLAKLYLRSGDYRAAAQECRLALKIDSTDQSAVYRLIQALRKEGDNQETSELVKRLAELRRESAREESERNRFRLADDSQP